MSRISKVSYVSDGCLTHVVDIPDSKIISIGELLKTDSQDARDTFMYAVERALAMDISDYYNQADTALGINYGTFSKINVSFRNGENFIYDGIDVSSPIESTKYCVRQVRQGLLRCFAIGDNLDVENCILKQPFRGDFSGLSIKTAMYLESLLVRLFGKGYCKLDYPRVEFSESNNTETTDSVLLLLYQIVALGESRSTPLYVFISELPEMFSDAFVEVLSMLRYDCQVFIP